MLETKPQSVGRTSPSRSSARLSSPSALGAATARSLPPRPSFSERDSREAERAARRATGEQTRNRRMTRSEARLLTWTVSSATVVCGLLVLYLAAYAHLTMLGIESAKAQHDYREKWQTNQMLRAQVAALRNPDRIAAKAVRLGLTKDSKRVDYFLPPRTAPQSAAILPPAPPVLALGDGPRQDAFSDDASSDNNHDNATMMTRVGGEAGPQGTDSGPTTDDNFATRHD